MKTKFLLALACCLFIAKANLFATTWTINVGAGGALTFSPATLTVTLGDTVTWLWSSGSHTTTSTTIPSGAVPWDHAINSGSTSYTYVPAATGDYAYKCTPHESMGMVGSFTVIACTVPVSNTIFGSPTLCAGTAETLAVPNGPGYTFAWYKNGVAVPGADSNTLVVSGTAGVYDYNVVVSNGCGADTTDTFAITVNPLPVPSIHDTVTGGSVHFSTDVVSGTTYLWNFGDGDTATTVNAVHTFVMAGATDTVTLTATNSNGCVGTAQIVITTPSLKADLLTGNNYFTIFPNPVTDEAIVSYHTTTAVSALKMEDVTGAVVYTTLLTTQQGRITIPVGQLPAGIYFLEISNANSRYMQKLVKQ